MDREENKNPPKKVQFHQTMSQPITEQKNVPRDKISVSFTIKNSLQKRIPVSRANSQPLIKEKSSESTNTTTSQNISTPTTRRNTDLSIAFYRTKQPQQLSATKDTLLNNNSKSLITRKCSGSTTRRYTDTSISLHRQNSLISHASLSSLPRDINGKESQYSKTISTKIITDQSFLSSLRNEIKQKAIKPPPFRPRIAKTESQLIILRKQEILNKLLIDAFYDTSNLNYNNIERLIQNNASVNICDKKGRAILYTAVLKESESIVELLLKNGANPNTTGHDRCTVLFYAIMLRNIKIINLLLKYNADINRICEDDYTPFSFLIERIMSLSLSKTTHNITIEEQKELIELKKIYEIIKEKETSYWSFKTQEHKNQDQTNCYNFK